jgi:two-component system nitrogen regulation response regulator GlnG
VAQQDVTVLILGESGSGKELAARAIYHYSKRSQKPFLAVNCAALPEALLESELFGHEKGSFTGADQRRIGKFEQVHGGTIFLDEIGDMTPSTQAKALRLLQQQQFERVGGNTTIQTDVRIIAATNKDLQAMVAEGKFRQDLYYRLSGFTLQLPPLAARLDDGPLLTDYFLRMLTRESGRTCAGITPEAREALRQHSWPGNIRELSSAIRYAAVHAGGEIITVDCLPPSCRGTNGDRTAWNSPAPPQHQLPSAPAAPDRTLPEIRAIVRELWASGSSDIYRELGQLIDRVVLEEALKATHGNQLQAAERLGISRMTLRAKLKMGRERAGDDSANGE